MKTDCIATHQVDYVLGLAKNNRLKASIADDLEQAKALYASTGEAARVFRDFRYQTLESWSCERRVAGKAEHLSQGENPRFIVSSINREQCDARRLYEDVYCAWVIGKTASRNSNWRCLRIAPPLTGGTPSNCGSTSPRSPMG